jgi:hypothetical protein
MKTKREIKSAILGLPLKEQISLTKWLRKVIDREQKRRDAIEEMLDEVLREKPSSIPLSEIVIKSRR